MSYAYLKARNARWWIGAIFSAWLAATTAAGALIVFARWPSDNGLRAVLAQARFFSGFWPSAKIFVPSGGQASAGHIVEVFDECRPANLVCESAARDVSLLFFGSPTAGAGIAVVILFFVARRRKNRNRDERLRGSSIVDSRALRRRVNAVDPD
jgi:hypothetical protein